VREVNHRIEKASAQSRLMQGDIKNLERFIDVKKDSDVKMQLVLESFKDRIIEKFRNITD